METLRKELGETYHQAQEMQGTAGFQAFYETKFQLAQIQTAQTSLLYE